MFHHMAPMAGTVTYAYQQHFVFVAGLLQGFGRPRLPLNRIVGVLQKVRTAFVDEAIGCFHGNMIFYVGSTEKPSTLCL
jgi:hypothetical protein